MNLNELATKRDLIELEERLDLKMDLKMDRKIDEMAKKIVDDITEVIADLMEHADERFRRLEVATGQPQGWVRPFRRLSEDGR